MPATSSYGSLLNEKWSHVLHLTLLLALTPTMSGCELVEGIFQIGFWAGIILIVFVLLIVGLLVRLMRGRA